MVIMALLPKAVDLAPPGGRNDTRTRPEVSSTPLKITTPEALPEAIAGRPYAVALAAKGGNGPLRWTLDGPIPEGLSFDPATGILQGTAKQGTPQPLSLAARVSDGEEIATRSTRLLVYQSDQPLVIPAWWKPGLPPVPWRAWLDQGVGFLVLWLVHLVGVAMLASLERSSAAGSIGLNGDDAGILLTQKRFVAYRILMRLSTLSAMVALGIWLWTAH
jgi:hypothetical protein